MNALDKVASLKDGQEIVISGIVYTRLDDIDDSKEWKVSPYGLIGDYDKACYWLDSESLVDELMHTTDLTRPPVFRQDTPQMQGATILKGIEGHVRNWKGSLSRDEALMLIEMLKGLHPWLPEKW